MAIGLGVLRLAPKDFWTMTPREFERAVNLSVGRRDDAPTRDALGRLMAAFPDR